MTALNFKQPYLAVDTETTGLNPWRPESRWKIAPDRPFAFSFCDWEGNQEYFRWEVDPKTRRVLTCDKSKAKMAKWLSDPKITKIFHNATFDLRMLELVGLPVAGPVQDTQFMMHVITGGKEMEYGLKFLSKKYLEIGEEDQEELIASVHSARRKGKKLGWALAQKETHGKKPVMADYWMGDPELCKRYALLDTERTMLLFRLCKPLLEADAALMGIYQKELRLMRVVKRMEDRGTRVFPEDLVRLRKFYQAYMDKQLALANASGGKGLNFRSSKQMVKKFYHEKGHAPKLNKAGNPSLDGDKLVELAAKDPLARAILEYRGGSHMLSAFLDPYERYRVEESSGTWVLHPNYRQCGPITGRFSCSDPNLMQVASETTGRRRTEITLRPREAFGPRTGYIWYMPDYSQIEVWVFAFLSQEKTMMEALLTGRDFHGTVAEKVWGKHPNYVEQKSYFRKRAKLLMFCKLYGGGVNKVAYLTDSSPEEAEKFVYEYDTELPGIKLFMTRMINQARREGGITNPFGRKYGIDPDFAYKAVNYLVQGTSADILKNAMIRCEDLFDRRWPETQPLLTLHDELVIEVPLKYHSKKLMKEIIFEMQKDSKLIGLPVPFPVDFDIATRRWKESRELCRKHLNFADKCTECKGK